MSNHQSTCPRCQAALPAEAAACPACGASFAATASEFTTREEQEPVSPEEPAGVSLENQEPDSSEAEAVPTQAAVEKKSCPVIDFDQLEAAADWNTGLVILFFGFLLLTSFT